MPDCVMVRASVPPPEAAVNIPKLLLASDFMEKVLVPRLSVPTQSWFQRVVEAPSENCDVLSAYGPFGMMESIVEVPLETAKRWLGEVVPMPMLPFVSMVSAESVEVAKVVGEEVAR